MGPYCPKRYRVLEDEILNRGEPIILPEEELPYFILLMMLKTTIVSILRTVRV